MTRVPSEVWQQLLSGQPIGAQFLARLALPDVCSRLFCAIDAQRHHHILIAIDDAEEGLHDAQSRGLSVTTHELGIPGEPLRRYLDIQCRDPAGTPVLDLIAHEIALAIAPGGETPHDIVRRVLAKWRRFWAQLPRSLLSTEQQLGLFGELWFLEMWSAPILGGAIALDRWRGPFGARHDFEWPASGVEVKATTSTRGRIHRIHGIDQLAPPEGGNLFLFSIRLREEASASNSLPILVGRLRDRFQADLEVLSQFEARLSQVGYSPIHETEYAKVKVRIIEESLFEVRDDFPRLTSTSFVGGPPVNIERLEYDINLNAFDHLCVARSAENARQVLQ